MRLNKTEIIMRFQAQDFERGRIYYEDNRVTNLEIEENREYVNISAVVCGIRDYDVSVYMSRYGSFLCECDCPRYIGGHYCKHIAAVLCAYFDTKEKPRQKYCEPISDIYALKLLNSYLPSASELPVPPVHLRPEIITDCTGYPLFRFKVGYEKMYVVKNLSDFVGYVCARTTASYGKNLTFCHAIENFDPESQKLVHILINEFPMLRTNDYEYNYEYPTSPLKHDKRSIQFEGLSFERIFKMFYGKKIPQANSDKEITFCEGDPKVSLRLFAVDGGAKLRVENTGQFRCFGDRFHLYAAFPDKIMLCGREFADKVYPIINAGRDEMFFEKKDLPTLCDCVLLDISDFVKIKDEDQLISQYTPDRCIACYYFDTDRDYKLTGDVRYRYGEKYIGRNSTFKADDNIKRSKRLEQELRKPLEQYFKCDPDKNDLYYIDDEDEAYLFLTDTIREFQKKGEVYISEALNRKRISTRKRPEVGISVSGGMLTLSMNTGEFPVSELESLYKSLILKKRYHKLPDGRYLPLDGSGYEKLAELAHMTQLSEKELQSGTVTMPAYRGLYLERVLEKNEAVNVSKNDSFRRLVREFKSVEDSDFEPPPSLCPVLRPYQKIGFSWLKTLEDNGFCGILADEMGLGKTIQVLAFLLTATRKEKGLPSIIVCPTSLILNWNDEIKRFAPSLHALIIMGTAAERKEQIGNDEDSDVFITSYDLLKRDIEQYKNKEFYCCVLDEGQNIKNQMTQASKAVKKIACSQRFVLTGTPIENRLSELWNLFDFLMPGYLFTHSVFLNKLEKPIIQSGDAQAQRQLNLLVQPFMLRRLKKDVLLELPPKIEYVRRIRLSQEERRVYDAAKYAARKTAEETQEKFKILALLTRLRQICCDPAICFENYKGESSKLNACIELCSSMAANGHQILIFSQFTSMLDEIRKRLYKEEISNFTIQGSTPKTERAELVRDFNRGGASVFLISLKAGGTGLNLTGADVVIHYDPWWNMAAQNQATDRAHRIGQHSSVQVYKLIAEDTIEEKILSLQQKKASLMDMLTANQGGGMLTRDEIMELLQ